MLKDIVDVLADPVDGSALTGVDDFSRLVSGSGHSYDVAKQGYVTLASGAGIAHRGDSPEMVASREAFLSRGHFAPFVETITERILDALQGLPLDDATATPPTILEVGAGTGYYLTHTLDAVENSRGIGVDIAVPAAKHLAKAHPKIGAVVADVWDSLPLKSGSVDVITVIFAPRNAEEFARVLVDDGEVLILTPQAGHLDELREPLGILGVEEGKLQRMIEQAEGYLEPIGEPELIEFPMKLDRESIAAQVGMSPSARHLDPAVLAERVATLPETLTVTARAQLTRMKKVAG